MINNQGSSELKMPLHSNRADNQLTENDSEIFDFMYQFIGGINEPYRKRRDAA